MASPRLRSRRKKRRKDNPVSETAGLPPGEMVHVGEKRTAPVHISLFSYNEQELVEAEELSPEDLERYRNPKHLAWINVDGVHDTEFVRSLGNRFALHPLVLEDIVNTQERPKYENYGDFLYFVLNMGDISDKGELGMEQVSIVLGNDYILSFQEDPDDIFNPIRKRLRKEGSRVRKASPDFLAYLLLDAVVDRYFLILEHLGEQIDDLEEELMEHPEKSTLKKIYGLKRDLSKVRRSVWPMREIVGAMQRDTSDLMKEEHDVFLKDFYDHILRVIDTVEAYRDTMGGMIDLYLSNSSIKMNEIMQVLTVISTIFIPLTFITGFYGMNFDFMPEVHSRWSYPAVIGIMALIVIAQLIYFKRKRWL